MSTMSANSRFSREGYRGGNAWICGAVVAGSKLSAMSRLSLHPFGDLFPRGKFGKMDRNPNTLVVVDFAETSHNAEMVKVPHDARKDRSIVRLAVQYASQVGRLEGSRDKKS